MRQYLFDSQQDDNKTVLVLNHGSLFNHGGDKAQVGYRPAHEDEEGPQAFEFYAMRDIPANEELLIHCALANERASASESCA